RRSEEGRGKGPQREGFRVRLRFRLRSSCRGCSPAADSAGTAQEVRWSGDQQPVNRRKGSSGCLFCLHFYPPQARLAAPAGELLSSPSTIISRIPFMNLHVVILAAGQGTRMRSALPKVLHPVAGKPMLEHVIDSARALAPARIHVVIGHGAEKVRETLDAADLNWVLQSEQLGTGHAVAQALPHVNGADQVLVLYGDVPLLTVETLKSLIEQTPVDSLGMLTVLLGDPTGYGRILRNAEGQVQAIVEQKDASPEQLQIREGNTGI